MDIIQKTERSLSRTERLGQTGSIIRTRYSRTSKLRKEIGCGEEISHIRKTKLVWVYLATVNDLYNCEAIGYAVSKKIDIELAKRGLGKQSDETELRNTGCPYDNTSLESFW